MNASSDNADNGILFNSEPSPANEPLNELLTWSTIINGTFNVSVIKTLPLNSDLTEPVPNTLNVPSGKTDALTEPVVIKFESNASSTNAERGILLKPSPLPLKNPPLAVGISILPTNTEPLSAEVTLN